MESSQAEAALYCGSLLEASVASKLLLVDKVLECSSYIKPLVVCGVVFDVLVVLQAVNMEEERTLVLFDACLNRQFFGKRPCFLIFVYLTLAELALVRSIQSDGVVNFVLNISLVLGCRKLSFLEDLPTLLLLGASSN